MRSPITFREWLNIIGIIFLIGASFILLAQLPFIDSFLDKISDFLNIQNNNIY